MDKGTKTATIIFGLIVAVSFGIHFTNRNSHFQECDSALVYHVIHEFPKAGLVYTAAIDTKTGFLSETMARQILQVPLVRTIVLKYAKNVTEEGIIQRLTGLSLPAFLRLTTRTLLSSLPLPYTFQPALALPFTSTYSTGTGLIYGIITHQGISYEDFMSRTVTLTLVLFHLSVILVFLILRRFHVNAWIAATSSFLMLFSITMYSYGYHLGNTMWNVVTAALWLWVLVKYGNERGGLKTISLVTGALLFFNYLIFFYWIAYLLAYLYGKLKGNLRLQTIWRESLQLLKSQWVAIVLLFVVVALFYPPGQGNRGTITMQTFFSDIYFVILNFVSFYNESSLWNSIQFVMGSALLIYGSIVFFRKRDIETGVPSLVRRTFGFLSAIYVVTVIFGVLGFAPSRHMLFLAPVIFVLSGVGLQRLFTRYISVIGPSLVAGAIIILGFGMLMFHLPKTRAQYLDLKVDGKKAQTIVVQDCAANLRYRNWGPGISVDFTNPKLWKPGQTFWYVSQTASFESAVTMWHTFGYDVTAKAMDEWSSTSSVYFAAYNPRNFPHTVSNSIYKALVTIQQIYIAPNAR